MNAYDPSFDPVLNLPGGFSARLDFAATGVAVAISHSNTQLWADTVSYVTIARFVTTGLRLIARSG